VPNIFWVLAVVSLLGGCAYSVEEADRAPPPISPGAVPDAIPYAEPITRAGNSSPYTVNGKTYTVLSSSLPIPTFIRVTNLENQASMVVRVNDRGPFHSDRILDLSYGAAVRLGFADQGTAKVRIESVEVMGVSDLRTRGDDEYLTLQLGAFMNEATAKALARDSQRLVTVPAEVLPASAETGVIFRVRLGPFETQGALRKGQDQLRAAGLPQGQPIP
jgi:rare lipoprotein A